MRIGLRQWTIMASLFWSLGPGAAWAGCSRVIQVPVLSMGAIISVEGERIGGVFPELMREAGAAAGCEFQWTAVPRARMEAMFEVGQSDVLVAATRTPKRDAFGLFVPMVAARAVLISFYGKHAPVKSLNELLARRELRVALVRGFDFGDAYQAAVKSLEQQSRVILESSPAKVARLMGDGVVDVTIMNGSTLAGAMVGDERLKALLPHVRIEALDELPWTDSGVYISRQSVRPDDALQIERIIRAVSRDKRMWDAYKRAYPPALVANSIRLP